MIDIVLLIKAKISFGSFESAKFTVNKRNFIEEVV